MRAARWLSAAWLLGAAVLVAQSWVVGVFSADVSGASTYQELYGVASGWHTPVRVWAILSWVTVGLLWTVSATWLVLQGRRDESPWVPLLAASLVPGLHVLAAAIAVTRLAGRARVAVLRGWVGLLALFSVYLAWPVRLLVLTRTTAESMSIVSGDTPVGAVLKSNPFAVVGGLALPIRSGWGAALAVTFAVVTIAVIRSVDRVSE